MVRKVRPETSQGAWKSPKGPGLCSVDSRGAYGRRSSWRASPRARPRPQATGDIDATVQDKGGQAWDTDSRVSLGRGQSRPPLTMDVPGRGAVSLKDQRAHSQPPRVPCTLSAANFSPAPREPALHTWMLMAAGSPPDYIQTPPTFTGQYGIHQVNSLFNSWCCPQR